MLTGPQPWSVPALLGWAIGLACGVALAQIWRRSGHRLARDLLREAEAARQAETEALLDGVKLAFGDITLGSLGKVADQLVLQTRQELAGERRSQGQQLQVERAELDTRMRSVLDQLDRLRELVVGLERDREGKTRRLEAELRQAGERADRLVDATRRLADTLASARARGAWGERLAEDLLRRAGLVEGASWRRQQVTPAGGRPDITFLLPDGAVLHMDVKFPLDNLHRSLGEAEGEGRTRLEAAFVRDVRARVAEIASRGYVAPEHGTLDLALMLIPNEPVFEAACRLAPDLPDEAQAKGVVLVSPSTLVPVLMIVRRAAGALRLTREAGELGRALAELQAAFSSWTAEADLVGRRLDEAAAAFRTLGGRQRARLERGMARVEGALDTVPGTAAVDTLAPDPP